MSQLLITQATRRFVMAASAALAGAILLTTSGLRAQNTLEFGDLVGTANASALDNGAITSIDPATGSTSTIGTLDAVSVALKNRNTLYALRTDLASLTREVHVVDVASGVSELVAKLPAFFDPGEPVAYLWIADIAREPSGMLLAYEGGETVGNGGTIYRIDPEGDPTQVPEVVVTDPLLGMWGGLGGQIKIDADGNTFVHNGAQVMRVQGNSVTEVWPGTFFNVESFDIDPMSGDLYFFQNSDLSYVRADPNVTPYTPVTVVGPVSYPMTFQPFALLGNGNIVHQTIQGMGLIDTETGTETPIASANYYHDLDAVRCSIGFARSGGGQASLLLMLPALVALRRRQRA